MRSIRVPVGRPESSPAFERRVGVTKRFVPAGRLMSRGHFHPSPWDETLLHAIPAFKRRATFKLSRRDNAIDVIAQRV